MMCALNLRKRLSYVYGLARFADQIDVEASVDEVDDLKVTALKVISRVSGTMTCEVDFEASLSLSLRIDVGGRFEDEDSEAVWTFPTAEVTFEYDPDASEVFGYLSAELTSVVELDALELDVLRHYR